MQFSNVCADVIRTGYLKNDSSHLKKKVKKFLFESDVCAVMRHALLKYAFPMASRTRKTEGANNVLTTYRTNDGILSLPLYTSLIRKKCSSFYE